MVVEVRAVITLDARSKTELAIAIENLNLQTDLTRGLDFLACHVYRRAPFPESRFLTQIYG